MLNSEPQIPVNMTLFGKRAFADVIKKIFFFFVFFRAAPAAYGGSQARGPVGATAAGLHHSHSNSNTGFKPRL